MKSLYESILDMDDNKLDVATDKMNKAMWIKHYHDKCAIPIEFKNGRCEWTGFITLKPQYKNPKGELYIDSRNLCSTRIRPFSRIKPENRDITFKELIGNCGPLYAKYLDLSKDAVDLKSLKKLGILSNMVSFTSTSGNYMAFEKINTNIDIISVSIFNRVGQWNTSDLKKALDNAYTFVWEPINADQIQRFQKDFLNLKNLKTKNILMSTNLLFDAITKEDQISTSKKSSLYSHGVPWKEFLSGEACLKDGVWYWTMPEDIEEQKKLNHETPIYQNTHKFLSNNPSVDLYALNAGISGAKPVNRNLEDIVDAKMELNQAEQATQFFLENGELTTRLIPYDSIERLTHFDISTLIYK